MLLGSIWSHILLHDIYGHESGFLDAISERTKKSQDKRLGKLNFETTNTIMHTFLMNVSLLYLDYQRDKVALFVFLISRFTRSFRPLRSPTMKSCEFKMHAF